MAGFDFDVVGFGALNLDVIVKASHKKRAPEKEVHTSDLRRFERAVASAKRSGTSRTVYGGSAFNTIRALANMKLGLSLGFAGVVGSPPVSLRGSLDEPRQLFGEGADQVSFGGLHTYSGPGGMSLSKVVGDERNLITYFDESISEALFREREALIAFLSRGRLLHVTSLFGGNTAKVVLEIVEGAQRARPDLLVSVDPGHVWAEEARPDNALGALIKMANYVFVNRAELELLGAPSDESEQVDTYLSKYHDSSRLSDLQRLIFFKEWDQGVVIGGGDPPTLDVVLQQPLPASRVSDPTGAGDVFAAGVLAGLVTERGRIAGATRLGLAAARHKLQRFADDGYTSLREIFEDAVDKKSGGIFISHANEDKLLATKVRDFLMNLGMKKGDIFFTSSADTGIAIGEEPIPTMYRRLNEAALFIAIVSPAYLQSHFCLYEKGAAWALGTPEFSIVVPAPETQELDDLLRSRQYGDSTEPSTLNELYRWLRRRRLVKRPRDFSDWDNWRDEFFK